MKLTSKELNQLVGGACSESDSPNMTDKNNKNKTEYCHCTYVNKSQTSNINKAYACSCKCYYE